MITVLCNADMLEIARPVQVSHGVRGGYDVLHVAVFDPVVLDAVPEEAYSTDWRWAWWREVGGLTIEVPTPTLGEVAAVGLRSYIFQTTGLSSARNLAGAVGDLARNLGLAPVDFMNEIAQRTEAVTSTP